MLSKVCIKLLLTNVHTNINESMQNALLKVRLSTVVLLVMERVNNHSDFVQGLVE